MNFDSEIKKTISQTGTIQKLCGMEGAIQKTIAPESIFQRTVAQTGSIAAESAADLTGGGVLGTDTLGDFLLGDPAITSYILWITKKSVI